MKFPLRILKQTLLLLVVCVSLSLKAQTEEFTSSLENLSVDIPISHADSIFLETIPDIKLADLDEHKVAPLYVSRMATMSQNLPWISYVDNDIFSRPNSSQILLNILKRPNHYSLRGGLWQWLINHPGYAGSPLLLEESINLYNTEGKAWDAIMVSTLANLIATIGTADQARILDSMQGQGGMGVSMAKQRYQNRRKNTDSLVASNNSDIQSVIPQNKQESSKTALPRKAENIFPTSAFVSITIFFSFAIAVWLVLKRRK